MGCCKKIIHRYSDSNRGVFCLTWVIPLRILVIGSLAIHLLYKIIYTPPAYSIILTVFHVLVALTILSECRRSVRYHKAIKDLEALGDRRRALR